MLWEAVGQALRADFDLRCYYDRPKSRKGTNAVKGAIAGRLLTIIYRMPKENHSYIIYTFSLPEASNIFGVQGRSLLKLRLVELPSHTHQFVETQLRFLDLNKKMSPVESTLVSNIRKKHHFLFLFLTKLIFFINSIVRPFG